MLNLMVEENARAKEANATALAARRRNHGEAAELEQKLSAARKVMVSLNEARKLEHQMLSGDVSFASIDGLKKLAGSLSRRFNDRCFRSAIKRKSNKLMSTNFGHPCDGRSSFGHVR